MAPLKSAQKKPYSRPSPRPNVNGQWLHDKAPTGPARGRIAPNPIRKAMAVTPAIPAGMNNRLRVSNLHYEVTPKDLMSIFGQIGTLVREPLLRVRPATQLPYFEKNPSQLLRPLSIPMR
ncbi:hypothetical protein BJ165DRAFT_1449125 [Panaeolus papilionaceus]|nr:hypothetical protein BJ165DRAFT_1449125 [Panaeolus papilionaceus]